MNVLEARRRMLGGEVYKKTAYGNPVSVRSLARMRPGLKLYGKSTQQTTTGAQLLNANEVEQIEYVENFRIFLTAGTYTFSVDKIESTDTDSDTILIVVFDDSGLVSEDHQLYIISFGRGIKQSKTFVIPEGKTAGYIYMYASNDYGNSIGDSAIFTHPMLNAGSTALPWEPYTGGQASPNPDYPQEIVSAGDDGSIQIDVTGANLFDASLLDGVSDNGITAKNVNGMIQVSGTVSMDYGVNLYSSGFFLNAGEYSIGLSNGVDFWVSLVPVGTHIAALDCRPGDTFSHGLIDSGVYTVRIYKECKVNENVDFEVYTTVSSGSTFYPYEPYKQPQTLTIQTPNGLPGIPVTSGGNYTDETGQQWICDEIDFKRGKYVQRIGGKVIGDNATFALFNAVVGKKIILSDISNSIGVNTPNDIGAIMSSAFKAVSANQSYINVTGISVETAGVITLYSESIQTVEQAQSYFEERPMTVIYALIAPIETDLSEEQLSAYANIHTNRPTTIVSATDGAGLELTYKTKKSLEVTA